MKVSCIDIGNTHTHVGLCVDGLVTHTGKLRTHQWMDEPTKLRDVFEDHAASDLAYCSVVPEACTVLEAAALAFGLRSFHLRHDNAPGLSIQYPKPEEIGEDRLANAICAQAFYGQPAVVIDMGTAVTFDIVNRDGAYIGGIIAPGVALMTHYLHEQTALLPELREEDLFASGAIGKSTQEAMKLGCVVGFSGMIRALLERVLEELGETPEPKIIGTGGTAKLLLREVDARLVIDESVTLRGLAEAWRRGQEASC